MPKARSPERDKAFELYKSTEGNIPLAEIAAKLGIPEGTIRGWKNKDTWNAKLNGTFRKNTERSKQDKHTDKELLKSVEGNNELTEQQKLFCLHYVKTYNATQSAIRAGYSPKTSYSIGYNLLHHYPNVLKEIKQLKAMKAEMLLADANDVVEKMMRIAFSDMTDFVSFKGDKRGVYLKSDEQVDGTMIREISESIQGIKIKLLDSQKALEWLGNYFTLSPMDQHRIEYDNRKLAIEEQKAKGETGTTNITVNCNVPRPQEDDNGD